MFARLVSVQGLVQGVGFRPFIYRIAIKYHLKGWVENRNDGVKIYVEGVENNIKDFIIAIEKEKPIASIITSVISEDAELSGFQDFSILKSKSSSNAITDICPDIAVCDDCIEDMKSQAHRIDYPFINCTNCGPRFTIIKDLPYDRKMTTMDSFEMCKTCKTEYEDILDRRFHAQPVACKECGPEYNLHYKGNTYSDFQEVLEELCNIINNGGVVAIKGLGGYFLACDASDEVAVSRMREMKNRDGKPFAVMFKDVSAIKNYASLSIEEEKAITSWHRPVVILNYKKNLAYSVSVDLNTIGCMLPYMPIHYLLFEKMNIPALVFTSGNISDEPIIIDDNEAIKQFGRILDGVLTNNRDIYNRTDDSVLMLINEKQSIIRRSRGYVPYPIELNFNVEGIFAAGAELVNSFCIGKGKQAILSQHIGDLKNAETLSFYDESVQQLTKLYRMKPQVAVHDSHPDYLSTRYAKDMGVELISVQHHHAHIASCMAENGLDEKVIGIAFDGTGLGDDGAIWGGEFLICDYKEYKRYTHFDYLPMPGGDKAAKQPWRMALSYLNKVYGNELFDLSIPFTNNLKDDDDFRSKAEMLLVVINKKINCPNTSSMGRLFDAVAAIINLCTNSSFHAEAPMKLESIINHNEKGSYPFDCTDVINIDEMIKAIIKDLLNNVDVSVISARFHNTIIEIVVFISEVIKAREGIDKVVMSGGTFQNRYLCEQLQEKLIENHFIPYFHNQLPCNDGGLSLGQLVIAARSKDN